MSEEIIVEVWDKWKVEGRLREGLWDIFKDGWLFNSRVIKDWIRIEGRDSERCLIRIREF